MKARSLRVQATFAPDTRFETRPEGPVPFRALAESTFDRLRNRLLNERLAEAFEAKFNSHLRRAANEAAALAWVTPYPLLVFPALFDEKVDAALQREDRQQEIHERSRQMLGV